VEKEKKLKMNICMLRSRLITKQSGESVKSVLKKKKAAEGRIFGNGRF